jgi:hypothetical protein
VKRKEKKKEKSGLIGSNGSSPREMKKRKDSCRDMHGVEIANLHLRLKGMFGLIIKL